MKFDFDKFVGSLKGFEVPQESKDTKDGKGIAKVIGHVWTHSSTSNVNFDSFTLDDVETVFDEMGELPFDYDDGGEMFTCDPDNLFVIFDQLFEISFDLTNFNNKHYELDEDDIFI